MNNKVAVVIGTRPEAIKLAPVILALQQSRVLECQVCATGQHRDMLKQVLSLFSIHPDVNLNLMTEGQTLAALTAKGISRLDRYLRRTRPRIVVVQGDTTTTLCATLAAFYNGIPVAHVEAGLRTHNLRSPWPEEANRVLTTRLTTLHFAPTKQNRDNLIHEGVPRKSIWVTGNTGIDALALAMRRVAKTGPPSDLVPGLTRRDRLVLITGHRRENIGAPLRSVCAAVGLVARRFPRVHFVYPVHPNPNVARSVKEGFRGGPPQNVHLVSALDYPSFVRLMHYACLVVTDSGGVQEEAPAIGKRVLVTRDTTERQEAIDAGGARLIGCNPERLVSELTKLLVLPDAKLILKGYRNPYGKGNAALKIVAILCQFSQISGIPAD